MASTKDKAAPPAAAVAKDAHWQAKMERLRARKPIERNLDVWLDDAAKPLFNRVRNELVAARAVAEAPDVMGVDPDAAQEQLTAAQATYDRVLADLDDKRVVLWLRGLGRDDYEALIAEHPPTDEQRAEGQIYDADTFMPALVSAVHCDRAATGEIDDNGDPVYEDTGESMSVAEAEELLKLLSQHEAFLLCSEGVAICTASRVDLGKGSGPIRS